LPYNYCVHVSARRLGRHKRVGRATIRTPCATATTWRHPPHPERRAGLSTPSDANWNQVWRFRRNPLQAQ